MADFRVVVSRADRDRLTFRSGRSISSEPPGAPKTVTAGGVLLKYAPTVPQTNLTNHEGAIAPGAPIQLIFWGDWWNGPGQPLRTSLEAAAQAILTGPYTSALDQYGISPPSYRGSYGAGGSPTRFGWSDVQKLVQGLIDADVFPEPDEEGGRNGYFVMLPAGSQDTSLQPECGAHGQYVDRGLLGIDPDHAWIAFINYGTLDAMTSCFSHELVELLTDPEQSAWYVENVPRNSSEIGDLCDIRENWVNGVKVRSYWSNRDQICVIPTDAYFSVRIDGSIDEYEVKKVDDGSSHPSNPAGGIGILIPACRFDDMQFTYTRYRHTETASLVASATGYHAPLFTWSVGGQKLSSARGTLVLPTDVTYPGPGGTTRISTDMIQLSYSVNGAKFTLTNDQVLGNFDVPITVSVDEDPTQSAQALNGARTAGVVASFVGATIDEPDYQKAVQRCRDAAREFWKLTHKAKETQPGPVNPGPIHERDLALFHHLPGWITSEQREAIRSVLVETSLIRVEAPEAADGLTAVLLDSVGLPTKTENR
jgi:hypothetical protein